MNPSKINTVLFHSWEGNKQLHEYLPPSLALAGAQRYAPNPYLIRISSGGMICLHDQDLKKIYLYDNLGNLQSIRSFPIEFGTILDFAVLENELFVLEKFKNQAKVSKIGIDNEVIWTSEIKAGQLESPNRILAKEEVIFFSSDHDLKKLLLLNSANGSFNKEILLNQSLKEPHLHFDGSLLGVTFFEEEGLRGITEYKPDIGEEESILFPEEMYGPLLNVFGFDQYKNVFIFQPQSEDVPGALACYTIKGKKTGNLPLNQIAASKDGKMTGYWIGKGDQITLVNESGRITIPAPNDLGTLELSSLT